MSGPCAKSSTIAARDVGNKGKYIKIAEAADQSRNIWPARPAMMMAAKPKDPTRPKTWIRRRRDNTA